MSSDLENIEAVIFDYGNTLVELGPAQLEYEFSKMKIILNDLYGKFDLDQFKKIRRRQIMAPYSNGFKENNIYEVCEEIITGLFNTKPNKEEIMHLVTIRHNLFLDAVNMDDDVKILLENLFYKFRLALLSNFPSSKAIHDALENQGVKHFFEGIVVSDDIGFVKPHLLPFKTMLNKMNLAPEKCLYIGDNWLADIQGAKRAGMKAVLTRQYVSYENFLPEREDFEPDYIISTLTDLKNLLKFEIIE